LLSIIYPIVGRPGVYYDQLIRFIQTVPTNFMSMFQSSQRSGQKQLDGNSAGHSFIEWQKEISVKAQFFERLSQNGCPSACDELDATGLNVLADSGWSIRPY
jgi:hypothetical protein